MQGAFNFDGVGHSPSPIVAQAGGGSDQRPTSVKLIDTLALPIHDRRRKRYGNAVTLCVEVRGCLVSGDQLHKSLAASLPGAVAGHALASLQVQTSAGAWHVVARFERIVPGPMAILTDAESLSRVDVEHARKAVMEAIKP